MFYYPKKAQAQMVFTKSNQSKSVEKCKKLIQINKGEIK